MRKASLAFIALGTLAAAGWLIWVAFDRLDEANNPARPASPRSLLVPAIDLPTEQRLENAEASSISLTESLPTPKKTELQNSPALDSQRLRLEATLRTIRAHIDELQSKVAAFRTKESNVGVSLREKQQGEAWRESQVDAGLRAQIGDQQSIVRTETARINNLKDRKDPAARRDLASARRALDRAKAKLAELHNRERGTDQQLSNQREADQIAAQSRVGSLEQTLEQINITLQNERARYETVLAELHALGAPATGGTP